MFNFKADVTVGDITYHSSLFTEDNTVFTEDPIKETGVFNTFSYGDVISRFTVIDSSFIITKPCYFCWSESLTVSREI